MYIYMNERKVIRYVNIIIFHFDDYDFWKNTFIFHSSSMGAYANFVFSCVASDFFDRSCAHGTFDRGISDFNLRWDFVIGCM